MSATPSYFGFCLALIYPQVAVLPGGSEIIAQLGGKGCLLCTERVVFRPALPRFGVG